MNTEKIECYLCCANKSCGEHQTVMLDDIPMRKAVRCPSCGELTMFDRYMKTFHDTRPFVFMIGKLVGQVRLPVADSPLRVVTKVFPFGAQFVIHSRIDYRVWEN